MYLFLTPSNLNFLHAILLTVLLCASANCIMAQSDLEQKRKIYHANRLNWPNIEGKMELIEENEDFRFYFWKTKIQGAVKICLGSDSTYRYEEEIESHIYYSSGKWNMLNDSTVILKSDIQEGNLSSSSYFFSSRFISLDKVLLYKNKDLYIREP